MNKVKSSVLDKTVKQYILSCIDSVEYDGREDLTTQEKIDFLKSTFLSEQDYAIKRVGEQRAMADWIAGLPTAFNIEYRNYEIILLAIKWGSIAEDATEAEQERIIHKWFEFIAAKTCQLFRGYKVPKDTIPPEHQYIKTII